MSGLLKFRNSVQGDERGPYHWNRADLDGAPFRGSNIPMATEEELADRLVRVVDPKNRIFDLSLPADNAEYIKVLDKIANGWGQLLNRELLKDKVRSKNPATGEIRVTVNLRVYIEWVEHYMEDGKPLPAQRPYFGRPNE